MKTTELKVIIDTAEQLGHTDIEMYYEDGRDGESSLTRIKAEVQNSGDQHSPQVIMVFKRDTYV